MAERPQLLYNPEQMLCRCGKCEGSTTSKMDVVFLMMFEKFLTLLGVFVNINSGYRCSAHNKAEGGAEYSLHLQGRAVDIACTSIYLRFQILAAAYLVGFRGIEISPKHVHLDNRASRPRLIWTDLKRVA